MNYCMVETCHQEARHIVGSNPLCCYHHIEETGAACDCWDADEADYLDAMAEQAMGSYNGKTPSNFRNENEHAR